MSETPQEAYDRGAIAGQITARLADHDKHFETINGHLADIAAELGKFSLAVQRLADQAVARDAQADKVALALKESEASGWSPVSRTIAIGGALASAAAVVALMVSIARGVG